MKPDANTPFKSHLSPKVQDKKTGETFFAEYSYNRLGNKRMWVNGKFYSDRDFDRKFKFIPRES
jgi:hypothetical protein